MPAYADLAEGIPGWSGMLDSGLRRLELVPHGLDTVMLWAASLVGSGLAEHRRWHRGAPVGDVELQLNAAHAAVGLLLMHCGCDRPSAGGSSSKPPMLLQASASGSQASTTACTWMTVPSRTTSPGHRGGAEDPLPEPWTSGALLGPGCHWPQCMTRGASRARFRWASFRFCWK